MLSVYTYLFLLTQRTHIICVHNIIYSKPPLSGNSSDNKVTVIVVLEKEVDSSGRALKNTQSLINKCEKLAQGKGGSKKNVYSNVLNGCSLEIPRAKVPSLKDDLEVLYYEEDGAVQASQIINPTWGLNRIDQCYLPLDGQVYQKMNAADVKVYILDTGIRGTHTEFVGMIDTSSTCHLDVTGEGDALNDGNGHGYVICVYIQIFYVYFILLPNMSCASSSLSLQQQHPRRWYHSWFNIWCV